MNETTRIRPILTALVPALVLLLSLPAAAQVGPWSNTHPAWIDINGNGLIDAGEVTTYPTAVFNPMLPYGDPDALYIVLAGNPFDACPGHVETRINATPLFNPVTLVRRHGALTDTVNAMGMTSFNYLEETPAPVPKAATAPKKPLANMTTASGGGSFTDTNGDGVYDLFTVSGMKGVTPVPATSLGFVFKDVNGDGKADYVSFPWAMTAVLGVKQSGACLGPGPADPQTWLPLNDVNNDGYPDVVSVRFPDPSGSVPMGGLDGIPIVPASQGGITAAALTNVPTLPVWALLAFSAALAGGGVFLLRGRVPGLGA